MAEQILKVENATTVPLEDIEIFDKAAVL